MKRYFITNDDEYLCKLRGEFTDKFGNFRRVMIYWSKFSDEKNRLKMIYLRAILELILIKLLNKDLNPKLEETTCK